jgi:hypothetical protein
MLQKGGNFDSATGVDLLAVSSIFGTAGVLVNTSLWQEPGAEI